MGIVALVKDRDVGKPDEFGGDYVLGRPTVRSFSDIVDFEQKVRIVVDAYEGLGDGFPKCLRGDLGAVRPEGVGSPSVLGRGIEEASDFLLGESDRRSVVGDPQPLL